MPNRKLREAGNVAIADVDIEGLPKELKAHSRIHSENSRGADVDDFLYSPKEEERFFTRYEDASSTLDGRKFPRFNDTEAKILEHIASRIEKYTEETIDLYTELDACQSCTNIIFEFKENFPNIIINIFSNSMG